MEMISTGCYFIVLIVANCKEVSNLYSCENLVSRGISQKCFV